MPDKYGSFAELVAGGEIHGTDFDTTVHERRGSSVLIIAPHGGKIEGGTSELAAAIAGTDYSLFTFNGLKAFGSNRDLHITSHRFDHPECLTLAAQHPVILSVHGCKGTSPQIYVGGLDEALTTRLTEKLTAAGLPATVTGHQYPGEHPLNICNRGARGRGAQLEFTLDFRSTPETRAAIAAIVRSALATYLVAATAALDLSLVNTGRS
jgi:phage replication-related protein YjqB (UPF0714/DUF867 family)